MPERQDASGSRRESEVEAVAKGRATTRGDRVLLSRFYRKADDEIAVTVTTSAMASQTAECPPHHWAIDTACEGVCRKCGARKQFPTTTWGSGENASTAGATAGTGRRDAPAEKRSDPEMASDDSST
jgi:hypothetical protein